MANTSDLIGVQATLDGLVAHSLTDFEDDTITELRNYAFYKNDALETVRMPNVTRTGIHTFNGCTALETAEFDNATSVAEKMFVDCTALRSISFQKATAIGNQAFNSTESLGVLEFPLVTQLSGNFGQYNGPLGLDLSKQVTFGSNAFSGSYRFTHLILRSTQLCPLNVSSAFTNSPISVGMGFIYVPTDLVATYKAATNWSALADQIVPISEYPKTPTGTISDSWATILASEQDGTYSTKYAVGDTRTIDIDGETVLMQIAAFDTDDLAASGKAKITWISKGAIERHTMNSSRTSVGGWAASEMRTYLRDTLFPKIESTVRTAIKEVTKTYRAKNPSDATLSITDTVWIPSALEVGDTSTNYIESSGVTYSGLSRTKPISKTGTGAGEKWFLRSAYNTTGAFRNVLQTGTLSNDNANVNNGLVLGFCT